MEDIRSQKNLEKKGVQCLNVFLSIKNLSLSYF
jgi:hypothetical protein